MWQYSQQEKLRWDSLLPTTVAAVGAAYFGAWTVRAFSNFRPDLLRGLILFLLVMQLLLLLQELLVPQILLLILLLLQLPLLYVLVASVAA